MENFTTLEIGLMTGIVMILIVSLEKIVNLKNETLRLRESIYRDFISQMNLEWLNKELGRVASDESSRLQKRKIQRLNEKINSLKEQNDQVK